MKKLVTITTLTAGIGASILGTTSNAHAAEYSNAGQHQAGGPQQWGQQPQHQMNRGYQGYNHQWNNQPQRPFNYHSTQIATQQGSNTHSHHTEPTATTDSNSSSSNSSSSSSTSTKTSSTSGNLYTAGQCTWYVYDKVGGKIGSTWGNANNWASAAESAGYTVNHTPEKGSILQSSAGSYGHVAYVESVGSDGSVTVSEMNYNGGPYVVDTRTISSSEASSYNYIHLD